jgi:hypothetical protein
VIAIFWTIAIVSFLSSIFCPLVPCPPHQCEFLVDYSWHQMTSSEWFQWHFVDRDMSFVCCTLCMSHLYFALAGISILLIDDESRLWSTIS